MCREQGVSIWTDNAEDKGMFQTTNINGCENSGGKESANGGSNPSTQANKNKYNDMYRGLRSVTQVGEEDGLLNR